MSSSLTLLASQAWPRRHALVCCQGSVSAETTNYCEYNGYLFVLRDMLQWICEHLGALGTFLRYWKFIAAAHRVLAS